MFRSTFKAIIKRKYFHLSIVVVVFICIVAISDILSSKQIKLRGMMDYIKELPSNSNFETNKELPSNSNFETNKAELPSNSNFETNKAELPSNSNFETNKAELPSNSNFETNKAELPSNSNFETNKAELPSNSNFETNKAELPSNSNFETNKAELPSNSNFETNKAELPSNSNFETNKAELPSNSNFETNKAELPSNSNFETNKAELPSNSNFEANKAELPSNSNFETNKAELPSNSNFETNKATNEEQQPKSDPNKIDKNFVIEQGSTFTKSPLVELQESLNSKTTHASLVGNHILAPKNYAREELQAKTYHYLKNVSEIHMQNYLIYINDTLKTFHFPREFDVDNIQRTWPALIPKMLQVPLTNLSWKGFEVPVITGHKAGRLGNVMGEYATLFALGRVYNVRVLLNPNMKKLLKKYFPFLTMKDLPDSTPDTELIGLHRQERDYNYYPIEFAAAGLFGPRQFIIYECPFEIHLFHSIREEITKEFRFSDKLMNQARDFLFEVELKVKKKTKTSEITYVGFHIRRKDYIKHMIYFEGEVPNEQFFQRALQYYRQRYTLPIFIVASDDRKFVKKALDGPNIYIVPGKSPAGDMAILTSCNHSIFTVGSYGFWTAYLTGGEVVYPDVHTNLPFCFSKKNYDATKLTSFIPLDAY